MPIDRAPDSSSPSLPDLTRTHGLPAPSRSTTVATGDVREFFDECESASLPVTLRDGDSSSLEGVVISFRLVLGRASAAAVEARAQGPAGASALRAVLSDVKKSFAYEVAQLPLEEGIKRTIEWLAMMENTPEGVNILRGHERPDVLDLRVPAIFLGLIFYTCRKGMNLESRTVVMEWAVGEEGDFLNESDLQELIEACANFRLPNYNVDLCALIAKQLLGHTLREVNVFLSAFTPEDLSVLFESNEVLLTRKLDEIFGDVPEQTERVMAAIRLADSDLYSQVLREWINLSANIRYSPVRGLCSTRELQALVRYLMADMSPVEVRRRIGAGVRRLLEAEVQAAGGRLALPVPLGTEELTEENVDEGGEGDEEGVEDDDDDDFEF